MKKELITTADGSTTIYIPEWNEHYHSKHGAIQEAKHVFIKNGLQHFNSLFPNENINILEIGFGTGLNAYLSVLFSEEKRRTINYIGIEAFPVDIEMVKALNFSNLINQKPVDAFLKLHEAKWQTQQTISTYFNLTKYKQFFENIEYLNCFDVIYFDAFGSRVQPKIWEESMFKSMYNALKVNGVLVTYSAKGSVRRIMKNLGFNVERLQGPPGKRHMLRATKIKG